jgi:hypothetical protein
VTVECTQRRGQNDTFWTGFSTTKVDFEKVQYKVRLTTPQFEQVIKTTPKRWQKQHTVNSTQSQHNTVNSTQSQHNTVWTTPNQSLWQWIWPLSSAVSVNSQPTSGQNQTRIKLRSTTFLNKTIQKSSKHQQIAKQDTNHIVQYCLSWSTRIQNSRIPTQHSEKVPNLGSNLNQSVKARQVWRP